MHVCLLYHDHSELLKPRSPLLPLIAFCISTRAHQLPTAWSLANVREHLLFALLLLFISLLRCSPCCWCFTNVVQNPLGGFFLFDLHLFYTRNSSELGPSHTKLTRSVQTRCPYVGRRFWDSLTHGGPWLSSRGRL